MAEIKVLDSSIYNKISAGEVVERPASVIKELTENSVDAGAKNITIEIKNGGIDEMTITDDGCGIENSFVKTAFLPHATSKIQSVEDLENINTLGFRGEALASIASVSQIEMLTKVENDELATFITLDGGNVTTFERCSAPMGTKFSVKNLFFNVPARKKFLKKPKQEEHEITTIVQRLILSNPYISIRYIVDGKQIYYSTGKNLEDAIFAVYGISTLQNLLKFDDKRNDMHLYGYIGKPSFTKPNRTYQTLIVNNRCVQNSNISVAVNKGFETHLMKGQFPFFVMFLDINPEKIDVNVHPTKMEVRFDDNSAIFSFVYRTVSNTILSNQDLYTIDMIDKPIHALSNEPLEKTEQEDAFKKFDNLFTNQNQQNSLNEIAYSNTNNFETTKITNQTNYINDDILKNLPNTDLNFNYNPNVNVEPKVNASDEQTQKETYQEDISMQSINLSNNVYNLEIYNDENDELMSSTSINFAESDALKKLCTQNLNENTNFKQDNSIQMLENMMDNNSSSVSLLKNGYKVVGKLFNTFLFVEHQETAILIDQHAAHERIIYDRLQNYYGKKDRATQPLLIPYILDVNYQEKSFIEQNIKQFIDLGFEIDDFGENAFKISAVPLLLGGNFDCKTFFNDILSQIGKELKVKESLHFDEYLMQRACKAAIKAGNDMSENEICCLVDAVLENNTELFCPHGRPIAIKIDRKDIEKWFKRVL